MQRVMSLMPDISRLIGCNVCMLLNDVACLETEEIVLRLGGTVSYLYCRYGGSKCEILGWRFHERFLTGRYVYYFCTMYRVDIINLYKEIDLLSTKVCFYGLYKKSLHCLKRTGRAR